jgi:hypothetical protein
MNWSAGLQTRRVSNVTPPTRRVGDRRSIRVHGPNARLANDSFRPSWGLDGFCFLT